MSMFEVNTKFGISNLDSGFNTANEAVDEIMIPPLQNISRYYPMSMRQSPPFPADGFELSVAVRYDTLFSNQFGSQAVPRYNEIIFDLAMTSCD